MKLDANKIESSAVFCNGLKKQYKTVQAICGINLTVERGSVVAILGPNGAGKTTLINILTTRSRPTMGRAWVLGHDILSQGLKIRSRIGVVHQENNLDVLLTVRENLLLHTWLHRMSTTDAAVSIDRALERAQLKGRAQETPEHLSGGMKRRLAFARALLHDPPLLFLDEPTTGLDPQSRRNLWGWIDFVRDKKTVVLTTHNMDEAERLADRVIIIDRGLILQDGKPAHIKQQVFGRSVFAVKCVGKAQELESHLLPLVEDKQFLTFKEDEAWLSHVKTDPFEAILEAMPPDRLVSMGYLQPTLEDVFIKLTGRAIRE